MIEIRTIAADELEHVRELDVSEEGRCVLKWVDGKVVPLPKPGIRAYGCAERRDVPTGARRYPHGEESGIAAQQEHRAEVAGNAPVGRLKSVGWAPGVKALLDLCTGQLAQGVGGDPACGFGVDPGDASGGGERGAVQCAVTLADLSKRPVDRFADEVSLVGGLLLDEGQQGLERGDGAALSCTARQAISAKAARLTNCSGRRLHWAALS